jgi:hypothetical protein
MRTRFIILAALLISTIAVSVFSFAKPKDDPNLYKVRSIYLGPQNSVESDADTATRLRSELTRTLQDLGFTVVENQSDGDAVITGEIGWVITFDAPQHDPPRYGYHYRLESSRYGVIWEIELDAGARSKSEADRIGLQRVARNLFNAWKKSATKAGIVVGKKLP